MARTKPSALYDDPNALGKAHVASRIVFDQWHQSDTELVNGFRSKWDAYYKAYRSYAEVTKDSVLSNFFTPAIFSHVESYLPRLVANRPRIEVWERGQEDLQLAEMHRALIYYDWDLLQMPFEMAMFVKSAEIFGTAVWKVCHKRLHQMRPVMEQTGIDRLFGRPPREIVREVAVYDAPAIQLLEVDRFYPHPGAKSMDHAPWVIEEEDTDFSAIENMKDENGAPLYDERVVSKLWERVKEANPAGDPGQRGNLGQSIRAEHREIFGPEMSWTRDPYARNLTLLHKWSDNQRVTVVKEYPDLEPLKNGYHWYGMKPYVSFNPVPLPNEFHGISIPEVLYSLNLEMNQLRNARMDHLMSSVHRMFKIIRGANVNPRQIRFRPNGFIEVDSPEDIMEMVPAPLDFTLYRETQEIDRHMQRTSGATDPFMGLEGRGGTGTATEASLLSQASGSRAQLMFQILSTQALGRLGQLLIRINERVKEHPTAVRVLGASFSNQPEGLPGQPALPGSGQLIPIDPDLLHDRGGAIMDVIIDVAATEPETRLFRGQRAIQAIQVFGGIPLQAWANPLLRRLAIPAMEFFDIERPDQAIAELAQMAMGQLQLEQQQQVAETGASEAAAVAEAEGGGEGEAQVGQGRRSDIISALEGAAKGGVG